MSYSNNQYQPYQSYQTYQPNQQYQPNQTYQGVQINLKPKPQYVGPTHLGYSPQQPVMPPSQSPLDKVSNKFAEFFSPRKQQGTPIFQSVSIISKKAQKVLDVCQDKDRQGMLIIYDDYKQLNQRFDILQVGDYVNIISKKNGKALTVGGNSQKNGAPIFEQPISNLVGQKFRLAQVENNEYIIYTFCGKALDCCEENSSNGTAVIQWKCDRKEHQYWQIK